MAAITMDEIGNIENRWGVKAGDYNVTLNSKTDTMDFQDLLVKFSKNRAVAVEGEVEPLTVRINQRNKRLDELGEVLSELTQKQAEFESDDKGDRDMHSWMSNKTGAVLESLGYSPKYYAKESDLPGNEDRADFYKAGWKTEAEDSYSANKKTLEGMLSRVKSEIDSLNNEAQTDMTRLQSLVDRRDESYSTATNLMTSVSDTRSNVIRNM
jgi:predicted  nucleic acid-binding Zn-ribbon protein